jgi:hypothetical protein
MKYPIKLVLFGGFLLVMNGCGSDPEHGSAAHLRKITEQVETESLLSADARPGD